MEKKSGMIMAWLMGWGTRKEKRNLDIAKYYVTRGKLQNLDEGVAVKEATALFVASYQGYVDIVQGLLAAGANRDKGNDNNNTPLFVAAQEGHIEVVNALIPSQADLNKAMNDEWTPLMCAAARSQTQVVQALLSAGEKRDEADWTKVDNQEGITVQGSAPAEIVLLLQQAAQT